MARKTTAAAPAPKDQLNALCGRRLSSLGDFERLAGVDTCNPLERRALWWQFQPLFTQPTQVLFDSVTNHCAQVALERITRGELCLLPGSYA